MAIDALYLKFYKKNYLQINAFQISGTNNVILLIVL